MKIALEQETIAKLNVLTTHKKKGTVKGEFPDFLIIGPQRTGTTWLVANLRYHPELQMSYPKELYFFNRLKLKENKYSRHYYDFRWHLIWKKPATFFREVVKVFFFDWFKTGWFKANELEWYMRFFQDDFISRFSKKRENVERAPSDLKPKMIGEATATYAILDEDVIQDIMTINPDMKAILIVRDPAERAWSHAKKDLVRNAFRNMSDTSKDEFASFFTKEEQLKCGNHTGNIDKWSHYLKPENLFVGFYDDIQLRPAEMLMDLFEFLGVTADEKFVSPKATQIINGTGPSRIPAEYKTMLDDIFKEEKERIKVSYDRSWT